MNVRCRSSRVHHSGFTLIEVLVTMALMGIVFPVAMHGLRVATNSARYARNSAEAATLAQTKLNEIVALYQTQGSNTLGSSGDFGANWPQYTWLAEEVYNNELGVIELSLVVNWLEPVGQRTLRLSTIILDVVAAEEAALAAEAEAG